MGLLQINVTTKELRKFGFIFGPLAIAISIWQATKGHWGHVYLFAPAGTYALIMAFVKPQWIYPLRWLLEKVFKLLMWLVTSVVLTLCFYFVFTSIGMVLRFMKKDLLGQKLDFTAETYWTKCEKQAFDPEHYKKQF